MHGLAWNWLSVARNRRPATGKGLSMNKAITDGIVFMPLPFVAGLGVWSSGDGTPGSDTYAGSGNGVFVSADQDFSGCLEVLKSTTVATVRYMAETPILPGCYLRVSAKVKAVAGPLPAVRIAGYAGKSGGGHQNGEQETGPGKQLTTYGEVVEISAIVGSGNRMGVDMLWDAAVFGHFGIDLTGPSGGLVRIDDIVIEDVTSVFQRKMLAMVDVRDYGAKGNGTTNDAAAFEAADAAANGRTILVSEGTYKINGNVTIENRIRFEGTVTQSANFRFILQKDYNYETYLDAFGNEEVAFRKAYQALINNSDHESLDLCGRRISLSEPVDMQAADPSRTVFATRRAIRNGQFQPIDGNAWNTTVVTSQATYSANNSKTLTNVANVANIAVGSRVTGAGVGREIYVNSVNIGQQKVTLNKELYDAEGTQTFTFRRYKYLLDFSGYDTLSQFVISDIDFQCSGDASGIMLAQSGVTFHLRDCFITKPKERGVTSIGSGCQGMMIDRCQFVSNENNLPVQNRKTIAFNTNANDVKIRDNRVAQFKHFCVVGGSGSLISGNHWFHGDSESNGVRKGGIIFTSPNCKTVITGNYIDNNFIEWTNEHDATPALGTQFSFGGMTITGNVFTTNDVADWFNFIVIKPYGPGHYINGFSVISNVFRSINGSIDRVEHVDTAFANLDFGKTRRFTFEANVFHGVEDPCQNPVILTHDQQSLSNNWIAETAPALPFGGRARYVDSITAEGAIKKSGNGTHYTMPWVAANHGGNKTQVKFDWGTAVKGKIRYQVRMDKPT